MREAQTLWPATLTPVWQKAEKITTALLAANLAVTNRLRQGITTYLYGTGIQAGYGFFSPNIPNSYKLVVELHYPDGHVEYDIPSVGTRAAGMRLAGLLSQIARFNDQAFQELLIKMIAFSIWQRHSDATVVRAVFGYLQVPTPGEVLRGQKESYHFLCAYDFDFSQKPTMPPSHGP